MNFLRSLVSAAPDKLAAPDGRDSMECEEMIVDSQVESNEKKDNGEQPKEDAEALSHPDEQLSDPSREACSPHFDPMQIGNSIKASILANEKEAGRMSVRRRTEEGDEADGNYEGKPEDKSKDNPEGNSEKDVHISEDNSEKDDHNSENNSEKEDHNSEKAAEYEDTEKAEAVLEHAASHDDAAEDQNQYCASSTMHFSRDVQDKE